MSKSAIKLGAHYTVSGALGQILDQAHERHADAAVAGHLVSSLLEVRFGDGFSERYCLNDRSAFIVGDHLLVVAMWASPDVLENCQSEYTRGRRPFLLVPECNLLGTRQIAGVCCANYLEIQSIEDFASVILWSRAEGSVRTLRSCLGTLLRLYNERIESCERDKFLLVRTPSKLVTASLAA
jgi:hypothetical protein